jgi:RNA polymerase primary sigma factor/RNA polymerase sigma factor
MNYIKYKAAMLRAKHDSSHPKAVLMTRIEELYEMANATKNEIVAANLRLVVSIAKRHVGACCSFFDLVSDGNLSLLRAVEKFDYSRGNRFSTYATWAITRNYARTIPDEKRHRDRYHLNEDELLEKAIDRRSDLQLMERYQIEREQQVDMLLNTLNEREQRIIVSRFGIGHTKSPLTLNEVGVEIGITKERVRQIEARALAKLRKIAETEKLEIPGL